MASEPPAAAPDTNDSSTQPSTAATTLPVQEPPQTDAGDATHRPVKRSWR
jgi:hypothetical protein